ncbi:sulfate adenylyltransferase, partial [Reticulomyxa filosa]
VLEMEKKGVKEILLRDNEYNSIAVLEVNDIYKPDKHLEAHAVFGGDSEHPAVVYLHQYTKSMYIGGKLHGFQLPLHYDHKDLRKTPEEMRSIFANRGWHKVVGFQTRNPMHRAHFELTKKALQIDPEMNLLVHPGALHFSTYYYYYYYYLIGMTKPGDIDHHTRVKCYRSIMAKYPQGRVDLAVCPLAMRMGGPREAIWHCIIRKNYGLTHFILGRDHAGPAYNSKNVGFYGPYDARDAAVKHESELGIKCLAFEQMLYCPQDDTYYSQDQVPEGRSVLQLGGMEVRERLRTGQDIPEWFSFKEAVSILREQHPPRHKQGLTLLLTGLPASGKSTLANALRAKLMEIQNRRVTILNESNVRNIISTDLGFTAEHCNLHICRLGFISSLVANAGGIIIVSAIAPYNESREFCRQICSDVGGYVQVFMSTSLDTCQIRDTKGLYSVFRQGNVCNCF